MSDLEVARIVNLPGTAYYLPNFISEEEEDNIIKQVMNFYSIQHYFLKEMEGV